MEGKMIQDLFVLIMAGGKGERFWPLGTEKLPKPFIKLLGKQSMIQMTTERFLEFVPKENIFIVLGKNHLDVARKQLSHIPEGNFIVEPFPRDTAPCIAFSSLFLERFCDPFVVVSPSDHYVPDVDNFKKTIKKAYEYTKRKDFIFTIGIKPERPETGYGYIEIGEPLGENVFKVLRFCEKPDLKKALEYISKGNFFWNSGIFVFRNSKIQKEIEKYLPDVWEKMCKIRERVEKGYDFSDIYSLINPISIDYGVMEKTDSAGCVISEFLWDDVGSWASLTRVLEGDDSGNVIFGKHIGMDTSNSVIYAKDLTVATLGVKDMVIVEANGFVLVLPKDKAQDLKKLLKKI